MDMTRPLYEVPKIGSIQDMLVRSARVYGTKLALEDLKDTPIARLSYAALLAHVEKFGSALRSLGVAERSHVAILGENRTQWGIAYLTCMCFNYVAVPIDRNLPINDILNVLHESDALAVIYSDTFHPLLAERRTSMKKLKHYINMDRAAPDDDTHAMFDLIDRAPPVLSDAFPAVDPEALSEIIFTSGSLGRAKGVMLSQKNIATNLMAMTGMVHIAPEDRFLSVLPMHHKYECTCGLLCPLYAGASVHYARSLKTVVEDLQAAKATVLLAVPLLYDKMFRRIKKSIEERKISALLIGPLVRASNVLEKMGWKDVKRQVFKELHHRFGGCVRLFITGGAAQDPDVARGLRELGFNFIQGYGLTETSPIAALNPLDRCKDDAAGLPLPGIALTIHEPNRNGVGEVWLKGASVMMGYYKNEKTTREAFENGWFKTGDLGFIDESGFLHIAGRQKNVIISRSGENVYPEELEDLLNRSRYVLESMVYGQDDAKQDEIIAAQVVPDAEAFIEMSETRGVPITDDLMREVIGREIAAVNKQVAPFKAIRTFSLRENEFEKTTTHKVKRYLVKNS